MAHEDVHPWCGGCGHKYFREPKMSLDEATERARMDRCHYCVEDARQDRVEWLVAKRRKDMEDRRQFKTKHGFELTRSQNFKKCVVIRWPYRRQLDIDHERIEERVNLAAALSDRYGLWEEDDPLLDTESRLLKIGIYCLLEWLPIWAIPDEYREVQDFVLGNLPEWARITRKA